MTRRAITGWKSSTSDHAPPIELERPGRRGLRRVGEQCKEERRVWSGRVLEHPGSGDRRTNDGERENEKRDERGICTSCLRSMRQGDAARAACRRSRPPQVGLTLVRGARLTGLEAARAGDSSCNRHPQPCGAGRRHAVYGYTHSVRRRAECRLARVNFVRPRWAATPQQNGAIFA
jgi:hypothetical protein